MAVPPCLRAIIVTRMCADEADTRHPRSARWTSGFLAYPRQNSHHLDRSCHTADAARERAQCLGARDRPRLLSC